MADLSTLSTDELFAKLGEAQSAPAPIAVAPVAAAPVSAPASAVPTPVPTPAAPSATTQAPAAPTAVAPPPAPDLSKASNEELFAAITPKDAAPDRSMIGDFGHQLGLAGRAAVNSVAALPAMASDAVTGVVNTGLDAVAGEGNGFRFQKALPALNNVMDAVGVPKPENAAERVVQDVSTGMGTAASGVGLGASLAKAAGPLTRAVGEMLKTGAGLQVASGAAGAGASGAVRENGGSEGAQVAAGLAAGLAPGVLPLAARAGVRGVIRGGETGRQQVAENLQTFQDATGTAPTLGQATGSRALQAVETGLSNTVGSSGTMIRRGEQQAEAMASSVRKLADQLSPNASGMEAGEAIARGVNSFRGNFKATQQRLYAALDNHIPEGTPIQVGNTEFALKALNSDIPGAPNISEFFKNAKIKGIDRALQADLEQAAAGNTLPYEAMKKLRTLVGNEMADAGLVSDVPRSKWNALYGALSDDLGVAATAHGPKAEQAWARANAFTRSGMTRLEQLQNIVGRDAPEQIFKAALAGTAEGGTHIRRLMRSLPIENRREVAAAALQRLGRAKPGQQNEMGDEFSSETFLTNLAAMSQPARQALFGSSGFDGLESKINQLGRVASMRREGSKVFSNPSGTARQAGMLGWAATLLGGIASGNAAVITGALVGPAVAKSGAGLMTSRRLVNTAATTTPVIKGTQASVLGAAVGTARTQGPEEHPVYKNRIQAGKALRDMGGEGDLLQTEEGWMILPRVPRISIPDEYQEPVEN